MKYKNKYLSIIFLILFLLSFSFINAEDFTYKQNSIIDLQINCYINGSYCSNLSICNLTLSYPNNTIMVFNQQMTNQIAYHNYTLPDSSINGIYPTSIVCCDGLECGSQTFPVYITPDGSPTSQAKSGSYSILTLVFLILTIIMLAIGIFSKNVPLFFLGLLFGLTFFLFTLQLIMINPDLKGSTLFYSSIVTFYKIYIWIYYAALLLLVGLLIVYVVQWNKYNKREKEKDKYGGLFDTK